MATLELPALYIDNAALVSGTPRPLLINRDPCPSEVGVPIDSTIKLELIDPGPDGIDRSFTKIWIDGNLAFEGGGSPEIKPAYAGPLASVAQTADALQLVLQPGNPLASQATVSVRVVSRTADGDNPIDVTYSFEVEDRTPPRLLSAQALGAKTVRLVFDEAVLIPTNTAFVFMGLTSPAVPVGVSLATVDGSTVTLSLQTEMTADVTYQVTVIGVTDVPGNEILAPYNTATFVGFRQPRPPLRRFDLWQMLPKHNRRDDQTGDLQNFIACLQDVTDVLLADVDRWANIFDLERAPENFLDCILQDLGNPFPFELDVIGKRRLASVLVEMYRQKGTAKGIRNAIRFFLGIEVSISSYNADTLALGESELGINWELGPSDRFALYAFNVSVGRILTAVERQQIRQIVNYLKPAHTHLVDLIEPVPPATPGHWELGFSELDVTTLLH